MSDGERCGRDGEGGEAPGSAAAQLGEPARGEEIRAAAPGQALAEDIGGVLVLAHPGESMHDVARRWQRNRDRAGGR